MTNVAPAPGGVTEADRHSLFTGSCVALISTSVAFAVVGASMGQLKEVFTLSNEQIGWIAGSALWGFAVSIFIFGPLCDVVGMKRLMRGAFLGHLVGPLLMILAVGPAAFWMLFAGAWIISFANGLVEAVCNPLVATLYPDRKTAKLNQFHVWFPGGILIGAVVSFALDKMGMAGWAHAWQVKLALVPIPTAAYGYMMLTRHFPATETRQSGMNVGQLFVECLRRPFFWLLLLCMAMTASTELGPNRWIPPVLEAGGVPGILVLAWMYGLMAVLRFIAGPLVKRFSPTGVLMGSAVLSALGLLWMSYVQTTAMFFVAATVFAVGVCYFWPTMLGVTSERVPRGGPLALALMGGTGMLVVGVVTSPLMGEIADRVAHSRLRAGEVKVVLAEAIEEFTPRLDEVEGDDRERLADAITEAERVLEHARRWTLLPRAEKEQVPGPDGEPRTIVVDTANALRGIVGAGRMFDEPAAEAVVAEAKSLLLPAENKGGLISFRYIVPLPVILFLIFLGLFMQDRRRGGYRAVSVNEPHDAPAQAAPSQQETAGPGADKPTP